MLSRRPKRATVIGPCPVDASARNAAVLFCAQAARMLECRSVVRWRSWMYISLQVNNVDALPAGISTGYAARDRSFEIGREACGWTLPDPNKFISGRHCEVRYEAGAFWLH